MATMYGGSTGSGYWRLEIDYTITEYSTYYNVNLQAYRYALKADTSGYDARKDTTTLYAYNQSGSGTPTWNHANSKGQRRWLWGWAANIWKTTYAYTVTIGGSNYHPSGTMKGTSSASINFTVQALSSYAITYNANGTNVSNMPGNGVKYYTVNTTISSVIPTRVGYTFQSWNTAQNGSGTTYNPGDSYSADSALSLYAQWTPKTFEIEYNGNGSTGGTTMIKSSFTYDQSAILKNNTYTKTDYVFIGWADTNTATTPQYLNQADVMNIISEGSKTLYAVWKFQYGKPNISGANAERASLNSSNDTIPQSNPFGSGAFITATVVLGTKEEPYQTISPTYTKISATCLIDNNSVSAFTLNDAGVPQQTYEYLITPSTGVNTVTRTWYLSDSNNLDIDTEYAITISASTLKSNNTNDIAQENGSYVTVTQITKVPIGSFLLDADPQYDSIGLFTIAPETKKIVLIGEEGDLWFELDDSLSNSIDEAIAEGINANYWDIWEDDTSTT